MQKENLIQNAKVLFVDDEEFLLKHIERMFGKEFNILTAQEPQKAIITLEQNDDIQVVVSDQRMPGMAGTDFLSEVRNRFPNVVRIMLTGYPDFEISYKAIKDGYVYDFIVKKDDYYEDIRRSLMRAVEWYKVQKEMKRLQNFVKQFEGTDILQIGRSILSMQDIMVRVADYDENMRMAVDNYYIKVEKYANTLFGILNNKEPADSVKGMDYQLFAYDRLLDITRLSKDAADFIKSDTYKNEIIGKRIRLQDLQNRIIEQNNAIPGDKLNDMIHYFELGSLIIYNKNKILHLQQRPDELRCLIFVKGEDEKIILREGAEIDGEIIKIRPEGKNGTAYNERNNTLGEPEQFLEIMLKKLKFTT
ncbi:MAG: response regulator [bacterium]